VLQDGESIDGLFRNKVQVIQARRGYRVCEDAVILTWFTRLSPGDMVLDVGTGSGAIAFGLAVKSPSVRVVGLEIQQGLVDRAGRGVRLNGLESRVSMIQGDFRIADSLFRPGVFDQVVSNPPYHEAGKGRLSELREKALARHQLLLPADVLFRVSARLLKPAGRISVIYPASAMSQMAVHMKETGFEPSRVLWIHPQKGSAPVLVCLEARPESHVVLQEDSLYLYDGNGNRTPSAEAILSGEDVADADV
jgi:tRNA1(Val) A37 N6-methylase TrmN6